MAWGLITQQVEFDNVVVDCNIRLLPKKKEISSFTVAFSDPETAFLLSSFPSWARMLSGDDFRASTGLEGPINSFHFCTACRPCQRHNSSGRCLVPENDGTA